MWESIRLENEYADSDWEFVDGPRTPSVSDHENDTETSHHAQQYGRDTSDVASDDEYGAASSATAAPRRKKGGYDSRIEQILYENPELPILIVDAGKSSENGGKYIVYTIKTGVSWCIGILNPQSDVDLFP